MAEPQCDPEDIACQARTIQHLRGLSAELGTDVFREQYPELNGLEGTIADKLRGRQDVLESTLRDCGILAPGEELAAAEPTEAEVTTDGTDEA